MSHFNRITSRFTGMICTVMAAAVMSLTSCVHEFPEVEGVAREVTLHIHHNLEWTPAYEHIITRSDNQNYIARYHHKICRAGKPDEVVSEMVFLNNDIMRGDFCHKLLLPPGDYEIWNWCDWADINSGTSFFFNSQDFNNICYQDPYTGHHELRDALRGVTAFTVDETPNADYSLDIDLHLERPLARYEVISTDLAEFIDKEVRSRRLALPESPWDSPSGVKPGIPTLTQYKVKVIYTGYMPSSFNNFLNRPVDSRTGVTYDAKIEVLNDDEAKICFDYVMVNGHESSVMARMEIYNEDGTLVAGTNTIEIPTKRNRVTIVRGKFLTSEVFGGVTIDPGFDGDYNIEIK